MNSLLLITLPVLLSCKFVIAESSGFSISDIANTSDYAQAEYLEFRQLHGDEINFLKDSPRVDRYLEQQTQQGRTLDREQAQRELVQAGASLIDQQWNELVGETVPADTLKFIKDEKAQLNTPDLFSTTQAEYENERINVGELFKDEDRTAFSQQNLGLSEPGAHYTDPDARQEYLTGLGQGAQASASEFPETVKETVDGLVHLATNPEEIPGVIKAIPGAVMAIPGEVEAEMDYMHLLELQGRHQDLGEEQGRIAGNTAINVGVSVVSAGVAGAVVKGVAPVVKGVARGDLPDKVSGLDSSPTNLNASSSNELTPAVVSNMPTELSHQATSGVKLVANPDKTTTVLGSYVSDTSKIIDELNYPKNLDFDAKQGGFNVLNTPDEFYKNPNQFWNEYNKPFLDKAIARGDDIILTTKPTDSVLNKYDDFGNYVGRTGFGKEIDYLKSKGYVYHSATKKMVKP